MSLIDSNDRLVLFGYGVFETLRVNGDYADGDLIEVPKLHYDRMKNGALVLGLAIPEYHFWLSSLTQIVCEEKQAKPYALRVTLSGGTAAQEIPSRLLHQVRLISYTEKDYREGVRICFLTHPRNEHSPCVHIKSTNYIENLLAKKEAEQLGAREGIWLNTKGHLTEGTMSNLFFIKNGVLYTPELSCGCLPGTRRQIVLECAHQLQIPVIEGAFSPRLLEDAEEVFLTNSLMGLLPVSQIENRWIPLRTSSPNSVVNLLRKAYRTYLSNKNY